MDENPYKSPSIGGEERPRTQRSVDWLDLLKLLATAVVIGAALTYLLVPNIHSIIPALALVIRAGVGMRRATLFLARAASPPVLPR